MTGVQTCALPICDSQLILSRTADDFLGKLFNMEVPEIAEGIVKIMGVSREPGFRAKIAVSSTESDVDPVGACVGMKGSRVQNVVQELQEIGRASCRERV